MNDDCWSAIIGIVVEYILGTAEGRMSFAAGEMRWGERKIGAPTTVGVAT